MFHSDEVSVFKRWEGDLKKGLQDFLAELRPAVFSANPGSVLISYTPDASRSPLTQQSLNTPLFAEQLRDYFRALGLSVEALPLTESLEQDLSTRRFAILLCTPAYATFMEAHPLVRGAVERFGQTHKNALQPLLCEGGFSDTAFKIVSPHYLVRDFKNYLSGHAYTLGESTASQLQEKPLQKGQFCVELLPEEGLRYWVLDQHLRLQQGELCAGVLQDALKLPTYFETLEALEPHWFKLLAYSTRQGQVSLDVCRPLEFFLEGFVEPAGVQGLGLVPDILELHKNPSLALAYTEGFRSLQSKHDSSSVEYRLATALEESLQTHPLKAYAKAVPTLEGREPGFEGFLDDFLDANPAKMALLLCPSKAERGLCDVGLSQTLQQRGARVLLMDCADYAGKTALQSAARVALQRVNLKDNEALQAQPLVLLLKGYEDLGAYDNLFEANKLSRWKNLKVLVTCQASFFQNRGYLNCFLKSGSERRIKDLVVHSVPAFAPAEAHVLSISPRARSLSLEAQALDVFNPSHAWRGHQAEVLALATQTRILCETHQLLSSNPAQNPQVFISYAWEPAGEGRIHQQFYLKSLADVLRALGLRPWLDIEQMSGDIDAQMSGNIQDSGLVLVLGTPLYRERAGKATNVQKEWQTLVAQQYSRKLPVLGLHYLGDSPEEAFPSEFELEWVDCGGFNQGPGYAQALSHPQSGVIPQLLQSLYSTEQALAGDYRSLHSAFEQTLALVPAKHLVSTQNERFQNLWDIDSRLGGYLKAYALHTEQSPLDTRFELVSHLEAFLKQKNQILVLLARAGSGKSLFALDIFRQQVALWQAYRANPQSRPAYLPFYLSLREYSAQPDTIIEEVLRNQYKLSDTDIKALQQGLGCEQGLLFIADGYDELGGAYPNLCTQLEAYPYARLVITSRPEVFDNNHPLTQILKPAQGFVESVFVSPFIPSEIQDYIAHYEQGSDKSSTYQTLQALPGMMALLQNPFLLNLVLQSLPQLQANRQASNQNQAVLRLDVYQAFVETWFAQETKARSLSPQVCQDFAEALAFELFKAGTLSPSPEHPSLWSFFENPLHEAVRDAAPLRFNAGGYSFVHKSVYEYFLAQHFYHSLSSNLQVWNAASLVSEGPVIQFLVERRQTLASPERPAFDDSLLKLIGSSKNTPSQGKAAANAITVLNSASVPFTGLDFSHTHLRGANLQSAICDGTNFEGADLFRVNLNRAWLSRASFKGANLQNVDFREWPAKKHKSEVRSCAYSIDGSLLAIGESSGLITIYDTRTLEKLREHSGDIFQVNTLAYSPDGTNLCSGSAGVFTGTLMVWDAQGATLEPLRIYNSGHSGKVTTLAYSPDGSEICSGSDDKTLKVWDARGGTLKALRTYSGHRDTVTTLAYSPDGSEICSGSGSEDGKENTLKVWDARGGTLEVLRTYSGHGYAVNTLAYSPDGSEICSGSVDNTLKVWDALGISLEPLRTYSGHTDRVYTLAYSPDGSKLCSGSQDKTLRVWDAKGETLEPLRTYSGHSDNVLTLAYSLDGSEICSGSRDKTLKVWDARDGSLEALRTYNGHTSDVNALAYSPDGSELCSGSGSLVCTGGTVSDKTLKVWDARGGMPEPLRTYSGHSGIVTTLAYSPDGKRLCSGSGRYQTSGEMKVWDARGETLESLRTYSGHSDTVLTLAYSPDGSEICSGSGDKTLKVWDALGISLEPLRTYSGHSDVVCTLAYSPDGSHLCSGSYDKTLKVWDALGLSLEPLYTYSGHSDFVRKLVYSPDGNHLCSGSSNVFGNGCTLKVWDAQGGSLEALYSYPGNPSDVSRVWGNSTEGNPVLRGAGAGDSTRPDFQGINLINSTKTHSAIQSTIYHPDGRRLATGHRDGTVSQWRISPNHQLNLFWCSKAQPLTAQDLNLVGAINLLPRYTELLQQRGAIGEPLTFTVEPTTEAPAHSSDQPEPLRQSEESLGVFSHVPAETSAIPWHSDKAATQTVAVSVQEPASYSGRDNKGSKVKGLSARVRHPAGLGQRGTQTRGVNVEGASRASAATTQGALLPGYLRMTASARARVRVRTNTQEEDNALILPKPQRKPKNGALV